MRLFRLDYRISSLESDVTLFQQKGMISQGELLNTLNLRIFPYIERTIAVEYLHGSVPDRLVTFESKSRVHGWRYRIQVHCNQSECTFFERIYHAFPLLEASLNRLVRGYSTVLGEGDGSRNTLPLWTRYTIRLRIFLILLEYGMITEHEITEKLKIPYEQFLENMRMCHIPLLPEK